MPVIESRLLFFDVETTGLIAGHDEVCEIASILTDLKLKEISRIEMKVRLDEPEKMKPEAAEINGYDPEVWAKESKPFKVWQDWFRKLVPYRHVAIGVGQNPAFDRSMIDDYYYKPKFCPISYHTIDTAAISMLMKVAGVLNVQNVKLETVMDALGLGTQTHRAMDDVEGAKSIFTMGVKMVQRIFGRASVQEVVKSLLGDALHVVAPLPENHKPPQDVGAQRAEAHKIERIGKVEEGEPLL